MNGMRLKVVVASPGRGTAQDPNFGTLGTKSGQSED